MNEYLTMPLKTHRASGGFSLVEMAIVLVIVGVLLGGLLPTISSQVEQQRRNETRKLMDETKEALFGFAISKGYLPCPASQVNGIEDRDGTTLACNSNRRVGFLPYATLGVNQLDGWGRLFRYSATPAFTTASGIFSIGTLRDITIQKRDASNLSNADDIPAVILSHGANGIFGTLASGNTIPSTASISYDNVADQQTNANGVGTTFVSGDHAGRTANNDEEFDDIVIWISPNVLLNRMIMATKLP